jgi:hypothetical protein
MQKCDMVVRNVYKNLGQNVYTLSIHIVGICIKNPTFCTHQKKLALM